MKTDGTELDPMAVEEALETLIEAESIKRKPALLKEVMKLASEKEDAIKSISDLKKAYAKIIAKEDTPEAMPKKAGVKKMKEDDDIIEESEEDKEIEKRVKNNE